jgi:2'-5' RNA ligase
MYVVINQIMRTFISLDVNDSNIIDNVLNFYDILSDFHSSIRLVNPNQLHFTLKFLGDVSSDGVKKISNLLSEINTKKFSVTFNSIGVFPNYNKLSIIWMGIDNNSVKFIDSLSNNVNTTLCALYKFDDVKFIPHVTLGRLKNLKDKSKLVSLLKNNSDLIFGTQEFQNFSLTSSKLTDKGPMYTTLSNFKFHDV